MDLAKGILQIEGLIHHFIPLPENILDFIDKGGVFALYKS